MNRRIAPILAVAFLAMLFAAAPAGADFGFEELDLTFTGPDGSASMQAGSHPYAVNNKLRVNSVPDPDKVALPDGGAAKDVIVQLPPGFAGNPTATPRCSTAEFLDIDGFKTGCPDASAIGVGSLNLALDQGPGFFHVPVYNLIPPPGTAARIGFAASDIPVVVQFSANSDPPYNIIATATNISQVALFYGSELIFWGNPAHPSHDPLRGKCLDEEGDGPSEFRSEGECPVSISEEAFITLPRACTGPLQTIFEMDPWKEPGAWVQGIAETHDDSVPPNPQGMTGCGKLGLSPQIESEATTDQAESPSGLDFDLQIDDEGITDPEGIADSDIKKIVTTLPEGMTVNPSAAEGLATCSPAALEDESIGSAGGCPEASKIGTMEAETPILEGTILKGELFVATQDDPATETPGAENPFDSLLALYIVIKHPGLGVLVKLAGKVEPDPDTGQLISTFDDLPQFPLARVNLHLREGGRSPLITPNRCGTHTTEVLFTPWANPAKVVPATASFEITSGVGGGACPGGGVPPFDPGFSAGTLNSDAGAFSPLFMRLTRADGEQDMTRFSSTFPQGLVGSIAGVSRCSDAQIAAARGKTGRQELAAPSCPANSKVGRVVGGAGVGSQLTYVGGTLHLAGPYKGDPLSVVAIAPAVAGPFDAGNVVVRVALTLNPDTAQVEVDGASSDPIPHILQGIVLKVRDLRVHADRPNFILNPTDCRPSEIRASLFGSFLDVFDPSDDVAVPLSARFQAANCASLGFKPKLAFRLKGGTKRGGHPSLKAVVTPRKDDANFEEAVVTLPRSAFLDQAHIRTICTRVQYAADACPPGSIYGYAKAWTPLLDRPLEGPLYLRSSDNDLPDLVAGLKGIVDIDLVGRIDSNKGGIRSTFEGIPDAPVSRFLLTMRGGDKGLIVNSRDLCAHKSRAIARFTGQNGRKHNFRPVVRATGCKARKAKRARR